MNAVKIVLVLLIASFGVVGQQPASAISPEDFNAIFLAGFKTTQEIGRNGLRFTETRGEWVLTVENDRRGSIRASYVNAVSGLVDSECVVIGDNIYERIAQGHWTLRTRDAFKAEQSALGAALDKARAEKDHKTHERIFAVRNVRATQTATFSPVFLINSTMLSFASPAVENRLITEDGRTTHNGLAVRLYKFTGTRTIILPPSARSDGVTEHLIEVDYWLNEKTGGIIKLRILNDWKSDVRVNREIVMYQWEPDPRIEIKPMSQTH
jgi:hypothetical protein